MNVPQKCSIGVRWLATAHACLFLLIEQIYIAILISKVCFIMSDRFIVGIDLI